MYQGHFLYQVLTLWDHLFLSYAADKQTNKQTNRRPQTFYPRNKNNKSNKSVKLLTDVEGYCLEMFRGTPLACAGGAAMNTRNK